MTTTIQKYGLDIELEVTWGNDWDADRVREYLGPAWSLTDRRRYPRTVIGFKRESSWVSEHQIDNAFVHGTTIERLDDTEEWCRPCSTSAVHLAVHPEFQLYHRYTDSPFLYVGVMEAVGQHHDYWEKNTMKYYGKTYRVVARLENEGRYRNSPGSEARPRYWTGFRREELLAEVVG